MILYKTQCSHCYVSQCCPACFPNLDICVSRASPGREDAPINTRLVSHLSCTGSRLLKEWGTSSSIGHGLSKRMNFRAINDMSAVDDFDVHRCAPSSDWICAKSKVRMISRYSCTCTLACLPKTIYTLTRWQDLLKVIRRPYHPYHTYGHRQNYGKKKRST